MRTARRSESSDSRTARRSESSDSRTARRSESWEARTLYLLRHGETPFHDGNRYCGRTDVGLTEAGEAQADQLAAWAGQAGLDAVYSSPLVRAARTAEPAARAAGLPVHVDDRLIELDFGEAEGLTSREMARRWPELRAAFEHDPVANPLPGGEDPRVAIARGTAAVSDIAARHPGGVVLAVCHSTVLRLVTCALTGIDPADYRREFPVVHNVSGAVLAQDDTHGAWRLVAFNPALGPGKHSASRS
ncbi:histidine phosphatase family protein [Haloechinothrix halophila]|uniref:histidine phosphatase family protein n=1 Tax=Haloechinothrix halophila TaxID=1069073 RepID=UPI0004220CEA|nr:histidine phosphatase family protein [Haloechinothrix halophila]